MILTVKQQNALNDRIRMLCEEEPSIEWVSQDECMQYRNSEYESLLIGFGKGKHTKHLQVSEMYNDIELTNYYEKQILYFMTVFKKSNKLQINTYKTNCPQVNGLNMSSRVDVTEV